MGEFSSPEEIEAAEEERRQEIEDAQEEEGQDSEEVEEEEQEEREQGSEDSEQAEEQEGEEDKKSNVSSDLDDILSGHSSAEVEDGDDEEEAGDGEDETGEETTSEYEPLDLEIDNDRFEEITSDPEEFQSFITEVRNDAVAEAREEFQSQLREEIAGAKEEILRNIPEVIDKTAKRTQNVRSLKDQFFEDNPQLENKMGYVRDITNVISTNNPNWGAKQVLDEVAKRANRDLDLSKQAEEREKDRKPRFAGAGGRRSPGGEADNRGKQDKLLDDTFGS